MYRSCRKVRGYTLVEIVLVVALFTIVAGMLVVLDNNFIAKNDLDVASETVTESLRRARILSTASSGDEVWGVHVANGSVTIFRGDSYSARDAEYDEVSYISSSVAVSGVREVVFGKVYGIPSVVGEIVLSSDINSSRVVAINEAGIVLH